MLSFLRNLFLLWIFLGSVSASADKPQVEFKTSWGNFVIELYPNKAPRTVENFLQYVDSGFYDGTIFHRAIEQFLVQGGGFTENFVSKDTQEPIASESNNGVSNEYGTVAMAHRNKPNSTTSQFFVNLNDNRMLNFYRNEPGLEGYTVFGKVIRGLNVLIDIGSSPTVSMGKLNHVPKEPPVIFSSRVLETPVQAEKLSVVVPSLKLNKKQKNHLKGNKRG